MNRPNIYNPYQKARENANLTQEKAVESLPVEVRSLQYYEAGRRYPNVKCAKKMSEIYNCNLNDLAPKEKGCESDI